MATGSIPHVARRVAGRGRREIAGIRRSVLLGARRTTAFARIARPTFYVLGSRKSGTTSLYGWLVAHPAVLGAKRKEPHYFDFHWHQGPGWYRAQFPLALTRRLRSRRVGAPVAVVEATTYYLAFPHAPARLRQTCPDARLIVPLRDPVDRAWSQYLDEAFLYRREPLSFEEAIDAEEERLAGEVERILADERYVSRDHYRYGYLMQGRYLELLERWWAVFPAEQILVLRSEDLFDRPQETIAEAQAFVGLPELALESYPPLNVRAEPRALDPGTRARLAAYFEPHNTRLYERLGRDLGWTRPHAGAAAAAGDPAAAGE